jgi:hypothetical protein
MEVMITDKRIEVYKMFQWLLLHCGFNWRTNTVVFKESQKKIYACIRSWSAYDWNNKLNSMDMNIGLELDKVVHVNFFIKDASKALQFKLTWIKQ